MKARSKKNNGTNGRQNQLRIIGGMWRGRKFSFPHAEGLRPTGDRIRETLFNWLAPHLTEARVLDLFAGSAALSLEAASRGAGQVTLVENNPLVCQQLQLTLDALSDSRLALKQQDALQFLAEWRGEPFDVAFLDPPFNQQLLDAVIPHLQNPGLLARDAQIYIETDIHEELPELPPNWTLHREKRAGNVCYRLYQAN